MAFGGDIRNTIHGGFRAAVDAFYGPEFTANIGSDPMGGLGVVPAGGVTFVRTQQCSLGGLGYGLFDGPVASTAGFDAGRSGRSGRIEFVDLCSPEELDCRARASAKPKKKRTQVVVFGDTEFAERMAAALRAIDIEATVINVDIDGSFTIMRTATVIIQGRYIDHYVGQLGSHEGSIVLVNGGVYGAISPGVAVSAVLKGCVVFTYAGSINVGDDEHNGAPVYANVAKFDDLQAIANGKPMFMYSSATDTAAAKSLVGGNIATIVDVLSTPGVTADEIDANLTGAFRGAAGPMFIRL